MRNLTEAAKAAKEIRAIVKAAGVKATIRSSTYSGGDSVSIDLLQTMADVSFRALEAKVSRYEMGRFDGMSDSYDYSNRIEGLPQVKFVFLRNLRPQVEA
jgi:hypothetical protein